ncbi:unnamed protein product, partial [Urochloa humidicola]
SPPIALLPASPRELELAALPETMVSRAYLRKKGSSPADPPPGDRGLLPLSALLRCWTSPD